MGFSRSAGGCARARRWLALKAVLFVGCAVFLSAAPLDQTHRPVRVRFEWRSEKPECWAGVLETSQGSVADVASLGVAGDEAGTLWADGKCLWLGRRNASNRDGFELTVIAPPSAHLSFTLQAPGARGQRQRFECLLADLEGDRKCLSAKSAAWQLSVRRAPGDALRIVVDRANLIYRPGEAFKATLVPDVLSAMRPTKDAKLKWQLGRTRNGETLKQGSLPVGKRAAAVCEGKGLPVEIPLPSEEGAISVHFCLSGTGPRDLRSSVQLLVLSEQTPRETNPGQVADTLIDRLSQADIESR